MLIANHPAHVVEHLTQLVACLNQAVQLTAEIIDASRNLGLTVPPSNVRVIPGKPRTNAAGISGQFPVADHATFSVRWHDNTCYLGNSLPFRLMERLAYRPNQLIHRAVNPHVIRAPEQVVTNRTFPGRCRAIARAIRRRILAFIQGTPPQSSSRWPPGDKAGRPPC
jgi:hypothetical protein